MGEICPKASHSTHPAQRLYTAQLHRRTHTMAHRNTKPEDWVTRGSKHTSTQFVPESHILPAGKLHSSEDPTKAPKLFTELKIGNMTVANRVGVSPMCTHGADHDGPLMGFATEFHKTHYNSFALRCAGLIMLEVLSVNPQGRISPEDLGIWSDEQALVLKEIVDFAHSQGVKIGCQIGHAARKASGFSSPIHLAKVAGKEHFGWVDTIGTVGPSAISFEEGRYSTPRELTIAEIKDLTQQYKDAAKRCYDIAGFDFVEIHSAHGYLASSFLSGLSNLRTDEYGGSFENRIRFLIETVDAVNEVRGDKTLFVRISATDMAEDGVEGAWTLDQSKKLADILAEHRVDLLDVSDGGNYSKGKRRQKGPAYQLHLAKAIKEHVGDKLLVSTVGGINEGKLANEIIESGAADLVLAGHGFLKNPGMTWAWADELGVRLNTSWSYTWPFFGTPHDLE